MDAYDQMRNLRDRYFDPQNYPLQNPYETTLPGNYYPYQPGYEPDHAEHGGHDYGNGRFGSSTYHQHVYSTLGGEGGGGAGGGGGHKSKNSGLAMNALTLLAFLFFINMLQHCLKEQMASMNPTVMVMTAGTSRFRKTGALTNPIPNTMDANKELHQNEQPEDEMMASAVADNVDMLTNDQGDVFYGPAPKLSFKLDNSFQTRNTKN